jgi:hypothetical protein
MTRLSVSIAAVLTAFAAVAQDIPFVPGQGSSAPLTEADRSVAVLAIDALAADLKIPKDKILVDTIRAVDWRNSSIGCPKPGVAYLEVITPGHKVTLRADGQIYVVHEAKQRAFVCHQTKAFAGIDPKMQFVFGQQMVVAQKDLADRLHVAPHDIKPVSAEQQTWDDAGLGCPDPGVTYAPGKVTGWVMTLRHGTRDFTYHTDLEHTIPCPAIPTQ